MGPRRREVAAVIDLVEFLRSRLDEDETAASAANVKQGDPDWWVSPVLITAGEHYTVRSCRDSRPIARVQRLDGDEGEPAGILDGAAVAEHIARHDPARVLAEVEAYRRIVELHQRDPDWSGWSGDWCRTCGTASEYPTDWPCETLRLLALPYAEHPDYDESWRP